LRYKVATNNAAILRIVQTAGAAVQQVSDYQPVRFYGCNTEPFVGCPECLLRPIEITG
jgi:hypothetical protein